MAVRIVTDSGSDCEERLFQAGGGSIVPMGLTYGEELFLDGIDIDKKEFYARLLKDKEVPVTSQPSPEEFVKVFREAKQAGDEVVAILISSALSGTFQSALLAKEIVEYEKIYLIDSLTATAAMRILVEVALEMARSGKPASEIARKLEHLKQKTKILAVVDTLEYLYKGGRLTRAQAGIGTLANLKPVITVSKEGTVAIVAKCVGRKRACRALLEQMEQCRMDQNYPAYFLYSADRSNCMNFRAELETRMLLENCGDMTEIGPTIGTHIGGGAFGIAFVEE